MKNWAEIEVNQMRNDAILWQTFRNDYLAIFGVNIDPNCKRGFYDKYHKLINHKKSKRMKTNGYQLKEKYNGIWYKGKLYRNESDGFMSDASAKALIKEHPNADALFARVPSKEENAKLSVEERIELVELAETIEELEVLAKGEKSKAVNEAIEIAKQTLEDNED